VDPLAVHDLDDVDVVALVEVVEMVRLVEVVDHQLRCAVTRSAADRPPAQPAVRHTDKPIASAISGRAERIGEVFWRTECPRSCRATVQGRQSPWPGPASWRENDQMMTQHRTGEPTAGRLRMTGKERREQLLEVSRKLFADKGFESTTVEEIAARAGVSKPVVYEHFGGKEGMYAVVVDREIRRLLDGITGALTTEGHPRALLEQAALALLDYIEGSTDGFRILVRDSPAGQSTGSFASLISDVASQVEHILAAEFTRQKIDPKTAPIYAQMLVGMVALTGQWWLDSRKFKKADVAAHLVNLAWNGLAGMEPNPTLQTWER